MYVWHQIQEHKSLHVTFAYTREVLLHVATWALTNRRIDISKWHDTSPLTTFTNKSEHTLSNDILTQGRGDHRLQLAVFFSSVFAFISHWDFHVMTLRELTGYTWKSRRVTCSLPWTMLQRTQVLMTSHPVVLFYTYTFTLYVQQNLSIEKRKRTPCKVYGLNSGRGRGWRTRTRTRPSVKHFWWNATGL